MSEIRATTISDSAGTGPITLTKQSAAKAWINFDGTGTIATRDSYNISSLTDNATGDYTTAFTSNFSNDDFAMSGTCAYASGNFQPSVGTKIGTGKTTSEQIIWIVYNQSVIDSTWVELSWHGDLA